MGAECLSDVGYDWLTEDLSCRIWSIMDKLHLIPRELRGWSVIHARNLDGIYQITFMGEIQGYEGLFSRSVAITTMDLMRTKFRMEEDVDLFVRLMKEAECYMDDVKNKHKHKKAFGKDMPA